MASQTPPDGHASRRQNGALLVVGLVAGAGFLTGLLANGGGFLLVPIFVLVLGLTAAQAAGTSMVAVAALIVPTLPRTSCSGTSTGRSPARSRSV